MRLVLLGPGSGSFLAALETGSIPYNREHDEIPLGVPMNVVGDVIHIVADGIPWASCVFRRIRPPIPEQSDQLAEWVDAGTSSV